MISKSCLVICGPSGVGKGTILSSILHQFPSKVGLSVSQTNRLPRKGEVHGIHYDFITNDMSAELDPSELKKRFLEYTLIHGNFYGTSYDAIHKIHNEGKLCVLDIDSHGVKQIKTSEYLINQLACNIKYLFIAPPSMLELELRLRGRGTENEKQIQTRLRNAQIELAYGTKENFDKIIVNDKLENAVQETIDSINIWFPSLSLKSTALKAL